MNALVVDDDYFVVTALEKKIDWPSLSIDHVYTAHNVAQAREILQNQPIDILISDIEMPQGSGLELLAWIREQNYEIQTIFLTNYADFNYAQKAIELQSFEYFLKPIQFDKLMLIIRKAVERANEQRKQEKALREGVYWQRNQAPLLEHFWRKLISSSATSSAPVKPADIKAAISEQHLAYELSDQIQPVLFNLFPYNGSMGEVEKNLFDYAMLNVLYELFQSSAFSVETVLEYSAYNWIAILKWSNQADFGTIEQVCEVFIQQANRSLKCDACCMPASSGALEAGGAALRQLLQLDRELVKRRNHVFSTKHYSNLCSEAYEPPDLEQLERLLEQNRPADFLQVTAQYLDDRASRKSFLASVLSLFRLDMMQLVYAFLKSKGIQAHQLYAGKTNEQLLARSLHSIEDMEQYLRYLVEAAMEYREFTERPQSVAEKIKHYIHARCGEDLTRNSLSEIVYLHPDYLARLFKKETGVSLGTYVIQVRIETAKRLLQTTDMSVFAVAKQVGYANYSYFSKLFKQEVGMKPNEYKRR